MSHFLTGRKMKLTVPAIALCLVCASAVFSPPVSLANTITYSAPSAEQAGKFTGELPIARIGAIALPDGMLRFSDDEMVIEAVPDWLFDRERVLKGVIVRAEVAAQAKSSVVAGLVFFLEGAWLKNLGSARTYDRIITVSGEEIVGRITARAGQGFSVQPEKGGIRKVNFSEIKTVVSPRAFAFNIATPTARLSPTDTTLTIESNLITLAPSISQFRLASRPLVPRTELAGTDPVVTKKAMATFLAIDLFSEIAPAIAIPLVMNRSTQAHALKQINDALNIQFSQNNSSSSSASSSSGSGTGM